VLSVDPDYLDGLSLLANLELIEAHYEKAEEAVDKALAQDENSDKLYNIKGRIFAVQEKWEESEAMFNRAIELAPDSFANHMTLLRYYEQRKDDDGFRRQLDVMMPKFSENAQFQILLANFHQSKKEFSEAEQALQKAIEINKDSIPFRLMLAEFYKKQKNFTGAEEQLKSSCDEFPENLQLKVALGELQFDLQKFDDAKALMDGILSTSPSNGGANLLKARFLIRDGKNNEAIEIINPLLKDYPKWADPFYYSALTHLRIGKPDLAQQSIDTAVQNNPRNDRFHALAAQIYLVRGDSNGAGKEASIALRLNPRNFTAVKILAKSLVQAKEFEKAIKLIEGVEKQVSGDAELIGSLSIAYLGMDEKEKAQESLTRLLEIVPDSTRSLALLAAITTKNDIPKSIDFVKKHIAKSNTGGHYLLLGELYVRNKQPGEALDAFLKAQQLDPENPQPYLLRARLLRQTKQTDVAIEEYNTLLQQQPDSIAGNMGMATIYDSRGEHQKAKEIYARILELKPDFPAAANNLAWLMASEENGDLGEALRLAMQAKQALPDQPHISDTLGWVHYKRKSYSLAVSQFQVALEKRPDDPVILYHLALAQYGNGEKEAAIGTMEKAVGSGAEFAERGEASELLERWKAGK